MEEELTALLCTTPGEQAQGWRASNPKAPANQAKPVDSPKDRYSHRRYSLERVRRKLLQSQSSGFSARPRFTGFRCM